MSRILIVEDEQPLNEAYTLILTKEGYEVASAFDGKEALDLVAKEKYDLILLDLRMPHMSGIEFLKAYDAPKKKPKIIIFSNLDDQKEIEVAYSLGAKSYILKAWAAPKDLLKIVRDALA